jgi:hypothetical protein
MQTANEIQLPDYLEKLGGWLSFLDARFTTSSNEYKVFVKKEEHIFFMYVCAAVNVKFSFESGKHNDLKGYIFTLDLQDLKSLWDRVDTRTPVINAISGEYAQGGLIHQNGKVDA